MSDVGVKVNIRRYQKSDRTAFSRLMEQLMDYIVSIDDLKRTRRMLEFGESYTQRTLQKVAENDGIIYVAEVNGQLVGAVVGIIPEQTKKTNSRMSLRNVGRFWNSLWNLDTGPRVLELY